MRFKRGESSTPGLRERRVSKTTGTTVSLYDAEDANIDVENRWVVTCEDHRTMASYPTLAEARYHLSSCEWCDECQGGLRRGNDQIIQLDGDQSRTECWTCGEYVVWTSENDALGDPLCEESDAMLLDDCDCCAVGARVSGRVYCADCASAAIRARCQECGRERELGQAAASQNVGPQSTPLLHALATGAELSILASTPPGPIEVIDVEKLPEPPPGSWAALLRKELLGARKGEN